MKKEMEEKDDSSADIIPPEREGSKSEDLVRPGAELESMISNDSLLDEVEAAEQAKM